MVEFGLKLQDNQVSEWREYYMDYEAFKKILKKAKNADKKYHDLREKNPAEADAIAASHQRGDESFITMNTSVSDGDLLTRTEQHENSSVGAGKLRESPLSPTSSADKYPTGRMGATSLPTLYSGRPGSVTPAEIDQDREDETSYLLRARGPAVDTVNGSQHDPSSQRDSGRSGQAIRRESSFHDTLSTISDHLGIFSAGYYSQKNKGSWYERQVRSALKERDDQVAAFDELFQREQKKVASFYYSQLAELEGRLESLTDSVIQLFGPADRTGIGGTDGAERGSSEVFDVGRTSLTAPVHAMSPFQQSRKQMSSLGHKVEEWAKRLGGGIHGSASSEGSMTTGSGDGVDRSVSKMHRRGVTNIRVGNLLQNDDFRMEDGDEYDDDDDGAKQMSNKRAGEADAIKRSLVSQYRIAKLLHNFAMMNITAFVKIVKKFDKTVPLQKGRFKSAMESSNMFNDGKAVEKLANKYETYFANWFCEGDLRAAKAQMLTKRGDGLDMDWSQLELGYRMGMCAVLAVWVCWDCIWGLVSDGHSTIGARAAFPVFRACGGLLLFQWFWGCSVFIWTRYRVNYIFLFDFIPSTVSTPLGIISEAVNNTFTFLVLILLYYKSGSHEMPLWIPSGYYPLILVLITILKLIFPLKQRIPMWNSIYKVVTAPFHSPIFFHTYIGDIFTSMVKVFQDVAWTICWVCAGDFLASEDSKLAFRHDWSKSHWYKQVLIPIITQIPLIIRFNQCLRRYFDTGDRFPHLANALKYALSQLVTLFGTFHPLYLEYTDQGSAERLPFYQIFWTILFVSSSLYSFTWDIFMDWGLGKRENGFLGPTLMYPRKYYYYVAMALDLVLRFMWVLTLVPPSSGASFAVPEYLSALTMMLELFRRTMWGFFRLENEHRSNVSGHRRVDFVPLHFHTGHQHMYEDKKERSGSTVLREVVLVAIIVGGFCFASIAAAQHANQFMSTTMKKEL